MSAVVLPNFGSIARMQEFFSGIGSSTLSIWQQQ